MKKITTIVGRRKSLIGLIGLIGLLASCSDDEEQPQSASVAVELTSYVAGLDEAKKANDTNGADEVESRVATRGWVPPTDPSTGRSYEFFDDSDLPISVFFSREKGSETEEAYAKAMEEEFFFKTSGTWRVSKTDLEEKTYYLYGYRPHKDYIEPSIAHLSGDGKTYADGSVLTLRNVNSVMSEDFCVVIGAKNGRNAETDEDISGNRVRRGDFAYAAQPTKTPGKTNFVFLLFDHLYAAMRFSMRVHGDYNDLRTIKLKDLSLETFNGASPSQKKTDITITLNATAGSDPIPANGITYTPSGVETGSESFYTNESGFELNSDYQDFQAHFMPQGITVLKLTSTYDVYDKQGNLVRENCKATNTIRISDLFSEQIESRRGSRYTIKMTIQPTYLYVLSEPDLDNPTVTIE